MGICNSMDASTRKIYEFIKENPHYFRNARKLKDEEIKTYKNGLIKTRSNFLEYKKRFKDNKEIYDQLFPKNEKDYEKNKKIEANDLNEDLTKKLIFFINKRDIDEIKLKNVVITFPTFAKETFPRFEKKEEESPLKKIEINSSEIKFLNVENDVKLLDKYELLINVEYLDLSFDNLKEIPNSICCLKNLSELNLRRNKLTELPKKFQELTKIKILNLSENCISELPKEITPVNCNLEFLDLSNNSLRKFIPLSVAENIKLKFLYLTKNKIEEFPKLEGMRELKIVNLNENYLTELPLTMYNDFKSKVTVLIKNNKRYDGILEIENKMKYTNENGKKKGTDNDDSGYNDRYKDILIPNPETEFEKKINEHIKQIIKINEKNNNKVGNIDEIRDEKFAYLVDKVETLINTNSQDELANIENRTLAKDFKMAYHTYIKKNEYLQTGQKPNPEKLSMLEKNYFTKLYNKRNEELSQKFNIKKDLVDYWKDKVKENKEKNNSDFSSPHNEEENKEEFKNDIEEEEKKEEVNFENGDKDKVKKKDKKNNLDELFNPKNTLKNIVTNLIHKKTEIKNVQNENKIEKVEEKKKKNVYEEENEGDKDLEILIENEEKLKEKVRKREDISNILFLKDLNEILTKSKMNLYLEYIGNIDLEMKEIIKSLWLSKEVNSFILLLSEYQIFVNELKAYYESKNNQKEKIVNYVKVMTGNKNVVYNIFVEPLANRLLFRIGLSERKNKKFKGIEQNSYTFKLDEQIYTKIKYFENFLIRFIKMLKTNDVNPINVEL